MIDESESGTIISEMQAHLKITLSEMQLATLEANSGLDKIDHNKFVLSML